MSWNDLKKGRFSQPQGEYLITFVCKDRKQIFHDHQSARIFCRQLMSHEQKRQCVWLAWVLMPDHFHGLLRLNDSALSATVGQLKGLTAKHINELQNSKGTIWQTAFHDHALRREEDRLQIARYIVANPIRAGLVSSVREYPYWNSKFF